MLDPKGGALPMWREARLHTETCEKLERRSASSAFGDGLSGAYLRLRLPTPSWQHYGNG